MVASHVKFEFPVGFQDSSMNGLVVIIPKLSEYHISMVACRSTCCISLQYHGYHGNQQHKWSLCATQMLSVCMPDTNVGANLNFEL